MEIFGRLDILVCLILIAAGLYMMFIRLPDLFHAKAVIRRSKKSFDSEDAAVTHATSLLAKAEKKVEIYDDGSRCSTALWNSRKFIETLFDKLEKNQSFQVICFIDGDATDRRLVERISSYPQVRTYIQKDEYRGKEKGGGTDPYLIIDNGEWGILPDHGPMEVYSRHFVVECHHIIKWRVRRLAKSLMFDGYRQKKGEFYLMRRSV